MLLARVRKVVHLLAVGTFIGSIAVQICLAVVANGTTDVALLTALLRSNLVVARTLTSSSLILAVLTGFILIRPELPRRRWIWAKAALVLIIGLNGALVITPIAVELVEMARTISTASRTPAMFAQELQLKSVAAGLFNVVLIVAGSAVHWHRTAVEGAGLGAGQPGAAGPGRRGRCWDWRERSGPG